MAGLTDRLKDDVLSDNTHMDYCSQCKNCKHWNGGTVFSNRYNKSNCAKYVEPEIKPLEVINNQGPCPLREAI